MPHKTPQNRIMAPALRRRLQREAQGLLGNPSNEKPVMSEESVRRREWEKEEIRHSPLAGYDDRYLANLEALHAFQKNLADEYAACHAAFNFRRGKSRRHKINQLDDVYTQLSTVLSSFEKGAGAEYFSKDTDSYALADLLAAETFSTLLEQFKTLSKTFAGDTKRYSLRMSIAERTR